MRLNIVEGGTYGYWTAIEYLAGTKGAPGIPRKFPKWRCRCVCGTERDVSATDLAHARSKSCGCIDHQRAAPKHGQSRTPLFMAWKAMIHRCHRPNDKNFCNYGGRGIFVHQDWHDFETFAKAVGPHPGRGLSLDRIDNSKGYFPGNVRWATRTEQERNKRTNVVVEFGGKKLCLQAWADELSVAVTRLRWRHGKGMTWVEAIEDIINHPPRKNKTQKKKATK